MSRQHQLLAALVALLTIAVFWYLLWQPRAEEITAVEARTEQLDAQAAELAAEIAHLEAVREDSPALVTELMTLHTIVPREPDLPAVLDQFQTAADESGVTVMSLVPARPVAHTLEGAPSGLASISIAIDVEGGYYQTVDFLRRLEDPAITARGLLMNAASVSGDPGEHPLLRTTMQGELFAVLPVTDGEPIDDPAAPAPEPEGEDAPATDSEDGDVEVEVEVDSEVEG